MASRGSSSRKKLRRTVSGNVKKLKPDKYYILHGNECETCVDDVAKNNILCQSKVKGQKMKVVIHKNGLHECVSCNAVFKRASHLQRHVREVHSKINNRPYNCAVCNTAFKRASQLECHSREVHSKLENRLHKCAVCHTTFKRAHHLRRHLREVHDQVKPYKCEQCNRAYTRISYLRVHMRSVEHCKNKPLDTPCKYEDSNEKCSTECAHYAVNPFLKYKCLDPNENQIDDAPTSQEQGERKFSFLSSTFSSCTVS